MNGIMLPPDLPRRSAIEDFLVCPQLHTYRWPPVGEHWVPRLLTWADWTAGLSQVWHAILALGLATGRPGLNYHEEARVLWAAQVEAWAGRERGRDLPPDALGDDFLDRLIANYPAEWRLADHDDVSTEVAIGASRLDMVRRDGTIVDHKLLFLRRPEYLPDRLRAFHTSLQAVHYCLLASWQYRRLHLTWTASCGIFVAGYDRKTKKATGTWEGPTWVREPVTFTEEDLMAWEHDVCITAARMAAGERTRNRTQCEWQHGRPCAYYEACWGSGYNEVTFCRDAGAMPFTPPPGDAACAAGKGA